MAYSSCASRLVSVLRPPSIYGLVTSPRIMTHTWRNGWQETERFNTIHYGGMMELTDLAAVKNPLFGAAIGLGVAAVGVPVAAGVLGFGSAGILSGSIGAKMMSAAAIANGGGVAAGGLVATLQSIGAAGVPTAVSAAATAGGAVLGVVKNLCTREAKDAPSPED